MKNLQPFLGFIILVYCFVIQIHTSQSIFATPTHSQATISNTFQEVLTEKSTSEWWRFKKETCFRANTFFETSYKNDIGLDKNHEIRLFQTNKPVRLPANSKRQATTLQSFKMQQYFKGIPVEFAECRAIEVDSKMTSCNCKLTKGLNLNTEAKLSPDDAIQVALEQANSKLFAFEDELYEKILREVIGEKTASFCPKVELVILTPIFNNFIKNPKLAYKIDVFSLQPFSREWVYVDAQNGEILDRISQIHHDDEMVEGSGQTNYNGVQNFQVESFGVNFRLKNCLPDIRIFDAQNTNSYPISDITHSTPNFNNHHNGVDVYWGVNGTVKILQEQFGWISYDNEGGKIRCWVNFKEKYNNAFYNGSWFVFGNGDGIQYNSFTPLDITAHEITHAITDHTANLVYRGESGAINESFSDIMGMIVECYILYGGIPNENTWLIGEDTTINGMGFRSMSHPNNYGDPHTYEGVFYKPTNHNCSVLNDWCGVHTNSAIMNYVFYLLVNGGDGKNDNNYSYQVSGIGLEKAAQIVFHAVTNYLQPTSNFFDAQQAMILAAENLYGDGNEKAQTEAAWCAVGIGQCQELQNKTLTLNRPNGGEVFAARTVEQITWESNGEISNVDLLYSINGTEYLSIAESVPNTGNYEWIVPEVHTTIARVKIIAVGEPSVFDISDNRFTIQNETPCQLTANINLPNSENLCTQTPIDFLDASSGTINSRKWFVNDQELSESSNQLQYTFEEVGQHTIKLEISTNEDCSDVYEKNIHVAAKPSADFGYASNNNLTLDFTAQNTTATNYKWELEGEEIATAATFSHTFPSIGTYSVCLSLSDACGEDSDCREVNVKIEEECGDGSTIEHFTQYTNGDNVTALAEDGEYIWVGTNTVGVAKIHKTQGPIEFYTTVNSPLPDNNINAIALAEDGTKWFGTDKGIAKLKNGNWQIYDVFSGLPSEKICAITIAKNHDVWIGMLDGFAKFDGDKWVFYTAFTLPNISVSLYIEEIIVDDNQNVWMSNNQSEILKFDGLNVLYKENLGRGSNLIFAKNEQRIWMVSGNRAIEFNPINEEYTIHDETNSLLGSDQNHAVTVDNQGNKWILSNNWLYKFDGILWEKYNVIGAGGNRHLLIDENLMAWVGISDEGLFTSLLDDNWIKVHISSSGLSGNRILDIAFEGDSVIWGATGYSGLAKGLLDNAGEIYEWVTYNSSNAPLGYNVTNVVVDTMGWKWVTGTNLRRFADGAWTVFTTSNSNIPSSSTKKIIVDINNNKWMATHNSGLVKISNTGIDVYDTSNSELPSNIIFDLASDEQGNIWISTSQGFTKFDGVSWTFFDSNNSILPYDKVDKIAIVNNQFWVESYYYTNPFSHLFTLTDFQGESVYHAGNSPIENESFLSLNIDYENNKWIGFGDRITKLSFDAIWSIHTTDDGFWSETNNNSYHDFIGGSTQVIKNAPDSSIWFGTTKGLLHLKTETSGINASFNLNQTICATATPITIQSSSIGGYEFTWFINNQEVSTQKDLHYTFNEAGIYIIRHTVSDGPDCTDSHTQTITVSPSADSLNPIPSDALECIAEDTTVEMELSAGVEGMETYTWRLNGDSIVSTNADFTATQSGIYTIEVQDKCGQSKSMEVEVILDSECVFPGDINYDGRVDQYDLVALGLTFSGTGPSRKFASLEWMAQACLNWEAIQENGANYKHADTDGSGLIDLNDFQAIKTNWLKEHNFELKQDNILSPISLKADVTAIPNLTEGGTLKMDILLDHEFKTPVSVHGLAFEVHYTLSDGTVGEPIVIFEDSELGTKDDDLLTHVSYDAINQKSLIGLTRFDNQNKRIENKVTTVLMEIEPVPSVDSLVFSVVVDNVFMVNSEGTAIPVAKQNSEVTILGEEVGIGQLPTLESYRIYPNPAQEKFTLDVTTEKPEQVGFSLHSLTGQEVWSKNQETVNQAIREEVDMLDLPSGIYFLKIQIGTDYLVEKIVKQ